MEKQKEKSRSLIIVFPAEELAEGMAARNTAQERLGHKVIQDERVTIPSKVAGDEAAAWAAKCAQDKHQYPSRSLYCSISRALQDPPVEATRALIRVDRAAELAKANKARDAFRARRARAVLETALNNC